MRNPIHARRLAGAAALALGLAAAAQPAGAQLARVHEQFYMPAEHNWVFRRNYPGADRLFNAFDYGHAILYEKLYRNPGAPVSELEEKEYNYITRKLLVSPPRLPLEEAAIEVEYVKLAPEAKMMFEWAHILHRQIYDVLGDERLSQADKDREVAAILRYYKSRPDLAFSSLPKNMELMEGQYYSTAFRENYPKFNGLIWGYHWLQVGLYEPLMVGRTPDERQTGVTATVARFRQMLENAPENMPRLMPMTAAVAPAFSARYPEAAIIFDNLHSMHDVISDILASPKVPRDKKREEILRAAERYRDNTSFVMTEREWRDMTAMMGLQNMGGPAVNFLPGFPRPTVARGAVMAHGNMAGMNHGAGGHAGMQHGDSASAGGHAAMQHGQAGAAGGHAGMQHGNSAGAGGHSGMQHDSASAGRAGAMDHSGMGCMRNGQCTMMGSGGLPMGQGAASGAVGMSMPQMMEMHERMMADPVIRERVATDPVLKGMMQRMHGARGMNHGSMPGGQAMNHGAGTAAAMDSAQAIEFAVRLLSDPEVEARVHADPRLHQMWSDPEVQRRLAELRRQRGAQPAAAPAPAPHRH
ncbi:MAG TPA: hypothetical protein VE913_04160 [Longimicrobium sp.]|nr:hypothetical protein [Longimicrobium sp.]